MREIKFRAWDGKQMRVVRLERVRQAYDGDLSFTDGEIDHGEYHDLDHFPLMQFTGLYEKKQGGEIYEGDIVRAECHYGSEKTFVVVWNNDRWGLEGQDDFDNGDYYHGDEIDWDRVEVIGNIHETPELATTKVLTAVNKNT